MMNDDICEATGETCPVSGLMNELTRLERQIEKMKCCTNCKHVKHCYNNRPKCEDKSSKFTKWELRTE